MFFFFHLITGIILGLLIGDILNDRRWIIPCIIGAVLPDIIDKPLNFIFLPAVNGDGRFLFHNLIIFAVILIAGLVLWKYKLSPIILSFDIGILSHQLLDSMWLEPVRWLYPLLGPYPALPPGPQDNLLYLLATDLFNPSEWILFIACFGALFLYWYRKPLLTALPYHKNAVGTILRFTENILWITGGIVVASGVLLIRVISREEFRIDLFVIPLVIIILAVVLIRRWGAAVNKWDPEPDNLRIKSENTEPFLDGFFTLIQGLTVKKKIMIVSLIVLFIVAVVVLFPVFIDLFHKILPLNHRHLR